MARSPTDTIRFLTLEELARLFAVVRISPRSLHLLQNCMVFVNTLMFQRVLAQPHWANRLTPRDRHAITPLIWDHVNPYGRYELDMDSRIPILT